MPLPNGSKLGPYEILAPAAEWLFRFRNDLLPCFRTKLSMISPCGTGNKRVKEQIRALSFSYAFAPQHFLYFFPDPQGQGSLRPTFAAPRTTC
jgi:hypothetical protein